MMETLSQLKNWLEWFERSEEKVQKVNFLEELGKCLQKSTVSLQDRSAESRLYRISRQREGHEGSNMMQ